MVPALRKRHRRMWTALAVLLPLGVIAAVLAIPAPVPPTAWERYIPPMPQYPHLLREADHAWVKVNLRASEGRRQLELVLKQPLTRPSCWVWVGSTRNAPEELQALGTLSHQGVYRFPLDSTLAAERLLVRDEVKQEVLLDMSLRP